MVKETQHLPRRLRNLSLLVLSFLVVAFGQPAWIAFLSPVAAACGYTLFWKSLPQGSSVKYRFWAAVFWFALVQAVQLSWMTSIEYQGYYILGVYGALIFLLGAQFGLFTHFVHRGTLTYARICTLSSLWTLMEWSRLHFLCGFSWNPAGIALSAFPVSMQLAAVFGVFGLSFWVMMTNLVGVRGSRKLWALCVLFPYLFGVCYLAYQRAEQQHADSLSVALVQTSLLPSQKNVLHGREEDFIASLEQWRNIFSLVGTISSPIDLIVLPEAALPFSADNALLAQALACQYNAEVIIGLEAQENGRHYNSAFHITSWEQTSPARYDKQVLLPLAEYLPFEWLRPLVKRYGVHEFFSKGKEAVIFHGKFPLSVSICYEETFGDLMREGKKKGAALFVNVTNDQWYPHSHLAKEHLHHAKLRAVENGLPLVRACNGGVSAIIDPSGKIVASIEEGKKGCFAIASLYALIQRCILFGGTKEFFASLQWHFFLPAFQPSSLSSTMQYRV